MVSSSHPGALAHVMVLLHGAGFKDADKAINDTPCT